MNHKQKTYTAEQAKQMADDHGDFDSSPKHLKREILALKKRVAWLTQIVNVNFRPLKVECDDCGSQWEGVLHSKCPVCGSYYD